MSERAGKKLLELTVADIKEELENRKLGTVGPKAALLERLEKELKNAGKDRSTYVFNKKKTAVTFYSLKKGKLIEIEIMTKIAK